MRHQHAGLAIWDPAGLHLKWANRSFLRWLGRISPAEESGGLSLTQLLPALAEKLTPLLRQVADTGQPHAEAVGGVAGGPAEWVN